MDRAEYAWLSARAQARSIRPGSAGREDVNRLLRTIRVALAGGAINAARVASGFRGVGGANEQVDR